MPSTTTTGLPYVLVTPARNEGAYIEETIQSVLGQTQRPLRWVLVSDGSTDRTDDIVRSYAEQHGFIEAVRAESGRTRTFASKVLAFRRGYEEIRDLPYAFVGNLDADVTLPPVYYERVLEQFARRPRLGISSAAYWYPAGPRLVRSRTRRHDVPGGMQLFRRACYDEIGGYVLLDGGGADTVAAIMARMAGWETRSFDEPRAIVRRPSGAAEGQGLLRVRFDQGGRDYEWGAHPLFMLAKAASHLPLRPYVFGSAALLAGYLGPWLRRAKRTVPDSVVQFVRHEQLGRLRLGFGAAARDREGDRE